MFRKVFQLCGVILIGWFGALAIGLTQLLVAGKISFWTYLLRMFITIGLGCGLGMVMILFNPHKVIQNYQAMRVHRMIGHRRDSRSFADKIGADDDD